MVFVDKKKVEDFIVKSFNYLNGKVNTFNTSVKLVIDWNEYSDCFGYFVFPNNITIFPYKILRIHDSLDLVYFEIFSTIIHELYHADQIINPLLEKEEKYASKIENDVLSMTDKYIYDNYLNIEKVIGYEIDGDSFAYPPNSYERMKLKDFFINGLIWIMCENGIIGDVALKVLNFVNIVFIKKYAFLISVNNEPFTAIIDGQFFIGENELAEIFEKSTYYNTYSFSCIDDKSKYDTPIGIIKIYNT